jgi:hypothetical protein
MARSTWLNAQPGSQRAISDPRLVAVQAGSRFGDVCLKCGEQEHITRTMRSFVWVPAWALVVVLAALPANFIFAARTGRFSVLPLLLLLVARVKKKAAIDVPLCRPCRTRWRWSTVAAAMALVAGVVGVFVAVPLAAAGSMLNGVALLVASLALPLVIYLAITRRYIVVAARIDHGSTALRGVQQYARDSLR